MVCIAEPKPATRSIAGGFVRLDVVGIMIAWRICRRPGGPGNGAFRAWLACHEMKSRRFAMAREDDRSPAYGFPELARLTDVSTRTARSYIRRLVSAGLLEWSDSSLEFPTNVPTNPVTISDLSDSIGGGRGSLAVPRRILRHLARAAKPAVIAAGLGALARCLSRRRGGFDGRGRIKAGWIARAFGVDVRAVKRARQELVALGWISPEASDQRAENRWGRAYRIDLNWAHRPPQDGRELPPLPPAKLERIATPSVDQDPSLKGGLENQEPAGRGPAGVQVREATEDRQASPLSYPPDGPIPPPKAATSAGVGSLPVPRLEDVRPEDLTDTARCLALHAQAVAKGLASGSEAGRLAFVASAVHCHQRGTNPPALMAATIRRAWWGRASQADEDQARRSLREHLHGPARAPERATGRVSTFVPDAPPPGPSSLGALLAGLNLPRMS